MTTMSDFIAGFSGRHAGVANALKAAFGGAPLPFEVFDLKARATGGMPRSFVPAGEGGPRHFSPLEREANPTEGWDPFDAGASTVEAPGFVDPIAAAHAAGHAEGFAAGLAQAAAEAGRDRSLVDALGAALGSSDRIDRERIACHLRQTVLALVGRLVGETGVAADLLANRIGSAVDLLADSAESALLHVHPDDVPLLDGLLPATLFPIGDASVQRGSFVLESASTIVEDGPEQWLEQLTQAIDRVAVPAAC